MAVTDATLSGMHEVEVLQQPGHQRRVGEWAYLAGLIDGEGSFTRKGAPSYSVRLRIAMASEPTIDWLARRFGGRKHKKACKPGHQQQWSWEVNAMDDLKDICEHTMPYLIEKKERAQRVVRFLSYARRLPPSSDLRQEKWDRLLKDMNKKEASEGYTPGR